MIWTFKALKKDPDKLKELQGKLKEAHFYRGEIDGIWGPMTENALKKAADTFFLNSYEIEKIGSTFMMSLERYINEYSELLIKVPQEKQIVRPEDIQRLADDLKVTTAHIRSVIDVEASGDGFLPDGHVKILFESHWFGRFTHYKFNSYSNISTVKWDRTTYFGGAAEYPRLKLAMRLDKMSALKSTSWGMGQVMGFNYKLCGYKSVIDFVRDQHTAAGQLNAIFEFIKNTKLDKALRNNDWRAFAKGYNGKAYYINKYHEKLERAFLTYA